jgi:hypothetical protein
VDSRSKEIFSSDGSLQLTHSVETSAMYGKGGKKAGDHLQPHQDQRKVSHAPGSQKETAQPYQSIKQREISAQTKHETTKRDEEA